jgi:hypothetical protein
VVAGEFSLTAAPFVKDSRVYKIGLLISWHSLRRKVTCRCEWVKLVERMGSKSLRPAKEGTLEVSGKGPVRLRVTALSSTSSLLEIGVDYSLAPVPHLHYDADYCEVGQSRTGVVLMFGKLKSGTTELRTKVEIAFSIENFVKTVWLSSRAVHEAVRVLSEGKRLAPLSRTADTEKVQCFRANNVFMAVLSSEAVLDFYYISPGDIHLAQSKKRTEVALEPVIRVVVSTPLLYEFLEKCRPLGEEFAATIGEEESGDKHA